jgi:uncharacterized protein YdeI (YjbR/CyaY-like superfamily)
MPNELQNKLDENPAWKAAFDALTPGRQRGYTSFIFRRPTNPKLGSQELKNACRKFSVERD